jgi:ABC-type microcin C transport system duplicated ATPase subunit YejF
MLTKAGYMNIVNELKAANSSEEVQNIINNAKIDGRSITFYKNSIQTGGKRKRIMISRRRQLH